MGFGVDKLSLSEVRCGVAGVTGLEPAASGVTGRRSNQLSYTPYLDSWWAMTGSNRRPSRCKRDALPAELIALLYTAQV